ncbi:hypothetical protein D3C73_910830 [compost metagenome]
MDSGSTILQRIRKWLAPSIQADSSRLTGMLLVSALFIMSRLNALNASGRINDQSVSSRPRLLTFMNSGMIPPLKNKGMVKISVSTVRPFNCLRDNGYAAKMVITIPSSVNSTVTSTDTPNERRMLLSAKIFLYASIVKPSGQRNTLFAIT